LFQPKALDDLPAQSTEAGAVQEQHALIVEPDTPVFGGKKQAVIEFGSGRRAAVGQLAAVASGIEVFGSDTVVGEQAVGIIHCYAPGSE
jgi:hypothetical protein